MHFHDEPIPDAPSSPVAKLPAPKIEDELLSPVLAAARASSTRPASGWPTRSSMPTTARSTIRRDPRRADVASTKKRADLDDMARQSAQVADREKKDVRAAAAIVKELQRASGRFGRRSRRSRAMPAPTKVLRHPPDAGQQDGHVGGALPSKMQGGKVTFVTRPGRLPEGDRAGLPRFQGSSPDRVQRQRDDAADRRLPRPLHGGALALGRRSVRRRHESTARQELLRLPPGPIRR